MGLLLLRRDHEVQGLTRLYSILCLLLKRLALSSCSLQYLLFYLMAFIPRRFLPTPPERVCRRASRLFQVRSEILSFKPKFGLNYFTLLWTANTLHG